MIKIKVFESKNLNDLAISVENFQNNSNLVSKGSLTFFNSSSGNYGVMSFFSVDKDNKEELGLFSNNSESKEKQTKKISNNLPTEKQVWRLNKMGYSDSDISDMTFEKARNIINAFMKNKLNEDSKTEEDIYL